MNNFSIRDIERLSGIKAHTLRIWEQRHGLTFCKRKESRHRYYDNEDLKQILRIAYLYHHGYKVSKIASLSGAEIKRLAGISQSAGNQELLIHQLLESSIDYDQARFEKVLDSGFLLGVEKCMLEVIYPFFEKIGLLWMTEHVLPAHEHFSSHLIQKKVLNAIDRVEQRVNNGRKVCIFAPIGEHHEVPLLFMHYLFKKNGWSVIYFGCNMLLSNLQYFCRYQPVTHLYLHLITNFLNNEPLEYLDALVATFPALRIVASGPAFQEIPFASPAVTLLRSSQDMLAYPGAG